MSIDVRSAQASLAEIDTVVARLKQSSFYRAASILMVVWGVLVAAGYIACAVLANRAFGIWLIVDGLGIAATLATGLYYRRVGVAFDWRIVVAVLLFFAFGAACSWMGHFGPRELSAFWPILFMFGYALAGLWLGRAFILVGVGVALLIFAGYLWIDRGFELYLAAVDGGGLVIAGLWMRRA